jgi:hypothetical protein
MLTDRELQALRNQGNEAEAAADEIARLRADLKATESIATKTQASATRIRQAGEALVHAYRERYKKRSTDGLRADAPLFREVADLNAALRA